MHLFSIQLVTDEYSKLHEAIDDLGSAIQGTLGRQKDDINRGHKTEMRKVQVELEGLTKENACLEESISTNERACQLETQRDWYKKEALHLDEVLEQTKDKQKELVDRVDETEQDNKWLKGQVEKLTKRNAVLDQKLRGLGIDVDALGEEEGRHDESSEQKSVCLEAKTVEPNAKVECDFIITESEQEVVNE